MQNNILTFKQPKQILNLSSEEIARLVVDDTDIELKSDVMSIMDTATETTVYSDMEIGGRWVRLLISCDGKTFRTSVVDESGVIYYGIDGLVRVVGVDVLSCGSGVLNLVRGMYRVLLDRVK